jgi:hypothetical protein
MSQLFKTVVVTYGAMGAMTSKASWLHRPCCPPQDKEKYTNFFRTVPTNKQNT